MRISNGKRQLATAAVPFFLIQICLLLFPATSKAVDADEVVQSGVCNMVLRVIGAADPITGNAAKSETNIESDLLDIRSQLEAVKFSDFKLREQQAQQLKVRQPGEFSFTSSDGDRQLLNILPVYVSRFNVKLALEWRGAGNETILATQLRIPTGQPIIVGADGKEDKATILAIKVECF